MSRVKQEKVVQDTADQLRRRFPNLVVGEDVKLDENGRLYGEVYRCTATDGPKLSGRVFANASFAVEIDMLSASEFESIMIALWSDRDDKPRKQFIFTAGARPKPTKRESKKLYVFAVEARPKAARSIASSRRSTR